MNRAQNKKRLFIVNPNSGNTSIDIEEVIRNFFQDSSSTAEIYLLPQDCSIEEIKEKIKKTAPDEVIAAGGDGTIKLVAECLLHSEIPLGILPAGSANGMAKELGIPAEIEAALKVLEQGEIKTIHAVNINEELCIHLSDIGFNAFVVKKFESMEKRGMLSYVKAAWKVLWSYSKMKVAIQIDDRYIYRNASMIVIANATKYGTGVLINPEGTLYDNLFEVIAVKKISLSEIIKMRITHMPYNPLKTEIYQTRSLEIFSKQKVHFQVDGEYLGKINTIKASIIPNALHIIVPVEEKA